MVGIKPKGQGVGVSGGVSVFHGSLTRVMSREGSLIL